ncbi:MAG: MFS transporter [Planctomycetia bacterium]|nr:MFS transporter [Planctomycetia bacterium]OQZ05946.1 MAG: hypothetical protein B6D36_07525 [Planctomycetes bacterium UTPLA1]
MRRGRNWFFLGLTYASYYFNRYNLSIASKSFCDTFGFDNQQYGLINSGRNWSYAIGQFWNGLLADRIGGRLSMAIGGYGTAVMNVLFGLGWYYKILGPVFGTLAWFVVLRSIDGYIQAFGAPGMVKMNTAWFARAERGRFAGIFGMMINLGRFVNNTVTPFLLAGFTIWSYRLPPGNWQVVFFVPALVIIVVTTVMLLLVKETPEDAGYSGVIPQEANDRGDQEGPLPLREIFVTILRNPMVWLTAWAYFCTGVVRYGVDDWFPKYFQEVQHVSLTSAPFQWTAFMIPAVATIGSIASGYVSDLMFKGRRAPVAAALYLAETVIILIGAQATSLWAVCTALILISFTCNATHSILGTAAAMDIGGRKMAGFAAGVIDSWQYIGAGLAGVGLGTLIDRFGWGAWLYSMAGFGLLGCSLMLIMRRYELAQTK